MSIQTHLVYTTPNAWITDHNVYIRPSDQCAFGFLGNENANGVYMFGGYTNDCVANYVGTEGGESVHSVYLADQHIESITPICDFLSQCKNYIVNVAEKMSSAKYDEMVEGVRLWGTTEGYSAYYKVFTAFWGFGQSNLTVDIMAGTEGLHYVGEGYGFHNIGINVKNIFITAYEDYNSYNDSVLSFFGFDSIKKAIDADYIDDPEIIDFIHEHEWENVEDSRCDWTINIDGVKNPDIAIMWNAPMIENGDVDGGSATVTIQIYRYKGSPALWSWETMGIYSYNDHTKKVSFEKLATEASIPGWAEFLTNIFSDTQVKIRMYVTYYLPSGMDVTSTAEATLTYKGQGSGSIIPPLDGSTITFTHQSTDEAISDFLDDIDTPDTPDGTSTSSKQQTYSGIGVMTRTYVMGKSRLQQLGSFIWSYNFYNFIQNLNSSPIENIVSIKMFPFEIPGGTDEEIVLGNVETGVLGKPVDGDYNCKKVINPLGTTIAKKYSAKYDYLNAAPFTKLSIFLPYIGFKELDASLFLDKSLRVEYIVDILTGSCVAMIYANLVPIVQFNGLMGLDIPISATNRAQVEAGIIQNVGQVALQLGAQNIGGAASSALNLLSNSFHTETQGISSPCCNSFITHDVFYILETPEVQFPAAYAHTHGLPLYLTKSLNKMSGFTVCDNVDTSGIQGATLEEKEYIKQALEEGVYL